MQKLPPARSFSDLEVYKLLYSGGICVTKEVMPQLPKSERFGLGDQMGRACKSPCALIAEGWPKRHQQRAFKKYLDDAIGECNEMIVHLRFARDLGYVDADLCNELIDTYDRAGKQLYSFGKSWSK